ncbi:hypothetical protein [Aliamphritea spongicola]|nr:hypothetical protein [Aliamphritea spongicola]
MYQLEQQFDRQREYVNRIETGRLNGSLEVSYEGLLETAELISIDARSMVTGQEDALAGFRESVARRFNALQLSGAVSAIYLYDQEAQLSGFWGIKYLFPAQKFSRLLKQSDLCGS